jgi:NarL family two-component system response regulator LiaR
MADGVPLRLENLRAERTFSAITSELRGETLCLRYFELTMKRHVLIYGVIGGMVVAVLQWTQYRFLVIEHSTEIYSALIAAIFAALGIWLGLRWKTSRPATSAIEAEPSLTPSPIQPPTLAFVPDDKKREELSLTRRELEILELVAQGLSNREIAQQLFVSENTVKTHCSRAFDKLGAKRRTQAVQLGKEFGLIP